MREYYTIRYAPNNIVFSIAGKFDWDLFCKEVEDLTGSWQSFDVERDTSAIKFEAKQQELTREGINLEHLMFMLPAPSAQDDLRYAGTIWNNLIGDSSGSRLYWDLLEPGLVESLYSWSDAQDGSGVSYLYAGCTKENLNTTREKVKHYLDSPLDFKSKDLNNSKTKLASRVAIAAEQPYNRMISIAEDMAYRSSLTTLDSTIKSIQNIDQSDMEKLHATYSFDAYGEYTLVAG